MRRVIHYHGTPISGRDIDAAQSLSGRHACVSFYEPRNLAIAKEVCQSYMLDNGAFSYWKAGTAKADWSDYYAWCEAELRHPGCDWAIIPDVIDGSDEANDDLLAKWPHGIRGVPVWHMGSSLERLERLLAWPRICIGSTAQYKSIGTDLWWARINEAMTMICDDDGYPQTKLHGLRMLSPDIFRYLPFSSADSTNAAINAGLDASWGGPNIPPTKGWKASVIMARIEAHQSATQWVKRPIQGEILCAT